MFLEVIALDEKDVIAIQQGGGDRVELVSNMAADGLSPTLLTLDNVMQIAQIPIRVMVRFDNNGFIYEKQVVKEMCKWMHSLTDYPLDGFVLGGITANGKVDQYLLESVQQAADGKKITFHRAFDRITNQMEALAELEHYQIDTILTSGGLQYPIIENREQLSALQTQTQKITILAGGGVNQKVIEAFNGTAIEHFHVGSCVRPNGKFDVPVSAELVNRIKNIR